MDRMGASELLISWPSTRTSRFQAWRSSSRSARRRSVSTTSSCGRPPRRNMLRRSSHCPCPPRKGGVHRARSLARRAARPSPGPRPTIPPAGPGCAASRRSPARLTSRRRSLAVEGEDGHVDLRHHLAQQRAGLDRAGALPRQGVGQGVDLHQHLAQGVVAGRAPAAHGEVPLAQRSQQVGDGVQRAHHPALEAEGARQPGEPDGQRQRSTAAWSCARRSRGGRARRPPPAEATAEPRAGPGSRGCAAATALIRCLLARGAAIVDRARCARAPASWPPR